MVGVVDERALLELGFERRHRPAEHHIQPRLQLSCIDETLVGLHGRRIGPGVVDHRQSEPARFTVGQQNLLFKLLGGDRRNLRRHEALRVVDQHANRLAFGVSDEASASRIRRGLRDASGVERRLVHERGVAVDAREIDGIIRRDGRQLFVRRPVLHGPVVLVPAPPEDPLAGPRLRHTLAHHLNDLVVAGGAAKVQRLQACTEPAEVSVRVLQPRQQRGALRVDKPRLVAAQRQRVGTAAHQHDAIAADRDSIGVRLRVANRVDPGVVDDECGGLDGRPTLAGAERRQ